MEFQEAGDDDASVVEESTEILSSVAGDAKDLESRCLLDTLHFRRFDSDTRERIIKQIGDHRRLAPLHRAQEYYRINSVENGD